MGSIWFVDVDYARAAMVEEESVKSGDAVECSEIGRASCRERVFVGV